MIARYKQRPAPNGVGLFCSCFATELPSNCVANIVVCAITDVVGVTQVK